MSNREHARILGEAIASMSTKRWNQWRMENPGILPDLSGEDLSNMNLSFINLSNADLRYTNLSNTNLHHANLQKADLRGSNLQNTDLSNANLNSACLTRTDLRVAKLRNAILRKAKLQGANLDQTDLKNADLTNALIDPEILNQSQSWLNSGISHLEKIALGLVRRARKNPPKAKIQEQESTRPLH